MAQHTPRFSRESASKADTSSRPRTVKRPAATNARANAQRTKLDLEREEREHLAQSRPASPKKTARPLPSSKRQGVEHGRSH